MSGSSPQDITTNLNDDHQDEPPGQPITHSPDLRTNSSAHDSKIIASKVITNKVIVGKAIAGKVTAIKVIHHQQDHQQGHHHQGQTRLSITRQVIRSLDSPPTFICLPVAARGSTPAIHFLHPHPRVAPFLLPSPAQTKSDAPHRTALPSRPVHHGKVATAGGREKGRTQDRRPERGKPRPPTTPEPSQTEQLEWAPKKRGKKQRQKTKKDRNPKRQS